MLSSFVPAKARTPIVFKLSGKEISTNEPQLPKADFSIDSNPAPSSTVLRYEDCAKAYSPIVLTSLPKITFSKLLL